MERFRPTRREAVSPEVMRRKERESVESLKEPITVIARELRPAFEQGAYSVIVGDDASGRIPARILGRIAAEFSSRAKSEAPLMRFIAGSSGLKPDDRDDKTELISGQLKKIRETLRTEGREEGKVLLVTEAIKFGRSIKVLTDALQQIGWSADVATVGIHSQNAEYSHDYLEKELNTKVMYGMQGTPDIYTKGKKLSGVVKDPKEIFATRDEADPWRLHWPASDEKQRAARDLADEVASQIIDELLAENNLTEGLQDPTSEDLRRAA